MLLVLKSHDHLYINHGSVLVDAQRLRRISAARPAALVGVAGYEGFWGVSNSGVEAPQLRCERMSLVERRQMVGAAVKMAVTCRLNSRICSTGPTSMNTTGSSVFAVWPAGQW